MPRRQQRAACGAITIWVIGQDVIRLTCILPAGHDGDHAADQLEEVAADA